MMRFLLAAVLYLNFAGAQSHTPAQLDAKKIDAVAEAAMRAWNAPGVSVAIVRDDRVVLLKGYGVKERGGNSAVTPRTVFAIGSTTKAFTTAAIAMLIDDGKMSWDDPVRKHIEFFRLSDPLASEQVTLRDLTSHRTGLSRNDNLWYGSPWSQEEIIRRIGYVKLSRPFRTTYQYQNIMFSAAGFAVGKASGSTWQDFVQRRILDPLGMTDTSFTTSVAERAPDHASPHSKGRGGELGVVPWRNLDNIAPAGSINSSAEDLAKWVRLQLNDGTFEKKRLISERNLREMHTPQMAMRPDDWGRSWNPETIQSSYGLGWTIHDYRGLHLVSHGGAIDGFRAAITLVPREKLGIVVLTNLGSDNMPEALRWSILDVLHGFPARDWNATLIAHFGAEQQAARAAAQERQLKRAPNTKPSLELTKYAGVYHDAAYGDVRILVESGALALEWANVRSSLEHFHYDTFQVKEGRLDNAPVVFHLNASGAVSGITFQDVDFRRAR
jgi:CubicO group peptidase (beta-lactamase class C family)